MGRGSYRRQLAVKQASASTSRPASLSTPRPATTSLPPTAVAGRRAELIDDLQELVASRSRCCRSRMGLPRMTGWAGRADEAPRRDPAHRRRPVRDDQPGSNAASSGRGQRRPRSSPTRPARSLRRSTSSRSPARGLQDRSYRPGPARPRMRSSPTSPSARRRPDQGRLSHPFRASREVEPAPSDRGGARPRSLRRGRRAGAAAAHRVRPIHNPETGGTTTPMSEPITLRGITWNHPRGLDPLLAANEVYRDVAPGVSVEWTTRSLSGLRRGPADRARRVVRPSRHRSPVRRRRRGEHGLPSARRARPPGRPPRTEPGECRAEPRELPTTPVTNGPLPSTPPRRSRPSTSASRTPDADARGTKSSSSPPRFVGTAAGWQCRCGRPTSASRRTRSATGWGSSYSPDGRVFPPGQGERSWRS